MTEIGSGINSSHVPAAENTELLTSSLQDSGEGGHRLVEQREGAFLQWLRETAQAYLAASIPYFSFEAVLNACVT